MAGRPTDLLGEWALSQLQHVLNEKVTEYLSHHLSDLGVATAVVGFVAPVLAYFSIKATAALFAAAPEPAWDTLNPEDERTMRSAFDDLYIVSRVARMLNENDAATLDDFKQQIRRIGLYGTATSVGAQPKVKREWHLFRNFVPFLLIVISIMIAIALGIGVAVLVEYLRGWGW